MAASNKAAVEAEIDALASQQRRVTAERLQSDTVPPVCVT